MENTIFSTCVILYFICRSCCNNIHVCCNTSIFQVIQVTFTTAVVSKSALKSLYDRKSPPGTIYYGKKSVRELFTTDSEVILQVKTCRNFVYG